MSESSRKHSTAKVPRFYRKAGQIVRKVRLEGASLKELIFQTKHRVKSLYALVAETIRHGSELDALLRRTKLLLKEPRLDPWVARVLITDMLWRQRALSGPAVPIKIVQSYKALLLSEKAALAPEISIPGKKAARPRFARVNTLKTTTDAIRRKLSWMGWNEVLLENSVHLDDNTKYSSFLKMVDSLAEDEFMQDLHIPDLLIFPQSWKFYEMEDFQNSSLILQDKASCLSAYLLEAESGSTVLDMCAAPGMKTTHVAASLSNRGLVYAIELNSKRYESLCKIVKESGATCVETIHGDAWRFSHQELPNVEYILVDPSCSGSGMCYRENLFNDSKDVSQERLHKLSNVQCALLRCAMTKFPHAKRIVYSTCSIFPEENEAVIDTVLKTSPPNFFPVHLSREAKWMKQGSSSYQYGSFGLYTQPQHDLTNGFFIAVFDRSENEYVYAENVFHSHPLTNTFLPKIKTKKKAKDSKKSVPIRVEMPQDTLQEDGSKSFEKLKRAMQVLCGSSD